MHTTLLCNNPHQARSQWKDRKAKKSMVSSSCFYIYEWQRIPQVRIQNLIRSLPWRCRIVLTAYGNHNYIDTDFNVSGNWPNLSYITRFFFQIFVQYPVWYPFVKFDLNIPKRFWTNRFEVHIIFLIHYAFHILQSIS